MSLSLQACSETDIPGLARLASLAFRDDAHTHLKAQNPIKPYDHESTMRIALQDWLSRPPGSIDLTKAVDTSTGQTLGWICWGARNLSTSPHSSTSVGEDTAQSSESQTSSLSINPGEVSLEESPDPLAMLGILTSKSLDDFMATVMPPSSRCMYVISLAVSPSHQRRGIGTTLVKHGTSRADCEDAYCWVSSSDGGERVFARCGFREVQRLEVDLAAWAQEVTRVTGWEVKALDGEVGWGRYVFRYMKRDAVGH